MLFFLKLSIFLDAEQFQPRMKHRIRDAIILRTGTVPARNKSLRKGQGGGGESRPLALFPETDRAILALIASRHCTAFPSVLLAHSGIVHIV